MKIVFHSSHAHLVLERSTTRVSGGAELQVALLARELAARGHEVVIAAGDTGQPDSAVHEGVRIRNAGKFQTGRLADTLRALPRVAQVLREERPESVFLLGWTTWLFILHVLKPLFGYKLGFICGLDTEVNGGFRRENPVRGFFFEYALRRCDIRFAMTEDQRRLFRAAGLDCGLYRNLILPRTGAPSGDKTIDLLWVSRCQPIKRPHLFLDLVRRLPKARCRMVCPREDVGLWNAVHARALELPNLEFIERVPYHEIQGVYDSAHIFVNTSEWEGWPNSFIQAGLGGTALLSLDVNPDGLFESYTLGKFCGGDFEGMVTAAAGMLAHGEELRDMQREAARFVAEMHDNQKETSAFLAGLREAKIIR
ncbi:MAG: glycosyltransferase family 4 protein [Chthoniobacterales bacterium]|nr:glycosyltransferase family 4 protein [Chthoniobacterales bacterium]